MKGSCLCGAIEFELGDPVPDLYQCHCSLCRKVSGAAANAAFRIPVGQLRWIGGREQISEYATASGLRSHFCRDCGSPVPNLTGDERNYWVPAGLLDDATGVKLVAQLYVGSRAPWDVIAEAGQHFDEMPDAEALGRLLQRDHPAA